jgi:hypothetical protein
LRRFFSATEGLGTRKIAEILLGDQRLRMRVDRFLKR